MVRKQVAKVIDKVKTRIDAARGAEPTAPWIKQVAMLTGVLAALSGFLDVRATVITNDAIYASNQAILAQSQASDAWGEYQADSIKARIIEVALDTATGLTPAKRAVLAGEAAALRDRQPGLKDQAAARMAARDGYLKDGAKRLSERDLLGYAGLMAQIGIALASVAALVRWRAPFVAGVAAGVTGVLLAAYALAVQYGVAG